MDGRSENWLQLSVALPRFSAISFGLLGSGKIIFLSIMFGFIFMLSFYLRQRVLILSHGLLRLLRWSTPVKKMLFICIYIYIFIHCYMASDMCQAGLLETYQECH